MNESELQHVSVLLKKMDKFEKTIITFSDDIRELKKELQENNEVISALLSNSKFILVHDEEGE